MKQGEFISWLEDGCPLESERGHEAVEHPTERLKDCEACEGTGDQGGSWPEQCEACGGKGKVVACTGCGGTGHTKGGSYCKRCDETGVEPCRVCEGSGITPGHGPDGEPDGAECERCKGVGHEPMEGVREALAEAWKRGGEAKGSLSPEEAREAKPCTECKGKGHTRPPLGEHRPVECKRCGGTGHEPGARFPGVFGGIPERGPEGECLTCGDTGLVPRGEFLGDKAKVDCPTCKRGETCTRCEGSGIIAKGERSRDAISCPWCDGEGTEPPGHERAKAARAAEREGRRKGLGTSGNPKCPTCKGSGKWPDGTGCKTCGGSGTVTKRYMDGVKARDKAAAKAREARKKRTSAGTKSEEPTKPLSEHPGDCDCKGCTEARGSWADGVASTAVKLMDVLKGTTKADKEARADMDTIIKATRSKDV